MKAWRRLTGRARTSPRREPSGGISIALLVAGIAVLAAGTAYLASWAEEETVRLERTLDQGHILELTKRQDWQDQVALYLRLNAAYGRHVGEGYRLQQESEWLRSPQNPRSSSADAATVDLRAQEEFTIARSLRPYASFARGLTINLDMALTSRPDDQIEKKISRDLADLGFETTWPPGPEGSIWKPKTELAEARRKVTGLTGAVVGFVAALALLTFARLSQRRRALEKALIVSGGILALAVTGYVVWLERKAAGPTVVWTLVLGMTAVALAPRVGRLIAKKLPPGKASEEAHVAVIEHERRTPVSTWLHGVPASTDPLSSLLISLMAIAVLLSAVSGWFYTRAATRASQAAIEALEQQVELFKSSSTTRGALFSYGLETFAAIQEYRLRHQAALQRLDLGQEQRGAREARDERADSEVRRWRELLARYETDPREGKKLLRVLDGYEGPEQDPYFPESLVAERLTWPTERFFAHWDAAQDQSHAYHAQAIGYLAALTVFAIGLFLFGQALSVGRTSYGEVLLGLGVIVTSLGLAGMILVTVRPALHGTPGPKALDAVKHYADARVLYETSHRAAGFAEAAEKFDAAAKARPTFAVASRYAASARILSASRYTGDGYISPGTKDLLLIKYRHGFENVLRGIENGDGQPLRQFIARGRMVLAGAVEDHVTVRLNMALAHLALGQWEGANDQYTTALDTWTREVAGGLPDPAHRDVLMWVLTDLEHLSAFCVKLFTGDCGELKAHLASLKSRLVGALHGEDWSAEARPPADVDRGAAKFLSLTASPAGLGWRAKAPDRDVKSGGLVVIWYALSDGRVWRAMPELVVPGASNYFIGPVHFSFSPYPRLADHHDCLRNGRYRAELYVEGRLADEREITLDTPRKFAPASSRSLNVSICRPEAWEPRAVDWSTPELARAYIEDVAGGPVHGAVLLTFYSPKERPSPVAVRPAAPWSAHVPIQRNRTDTRGAVDAALKRALHRLRSKDFVPEGEPRVSPIMCEDFSFASLGSGYFYRYAGATVRARAWFGREAMLHVGLVFHRPGQEGVPDREAAEREDCSVLMSLTNIE